MKQEITIPRTARVLVVEDNYLRIEWFKNRLFLDEPPSIAETPRTALAFLDGLPYDVVFLDHDAGISSLMGPIDFMPVAKQLYDIRFQGKIIIHSMNYVAARKMQHAMRDGTVMPFGTFELKVV